MEPMRNYHTLRQLKAANSFNPIWLVKVIALSILYLHFFYPVKFKPFFHNWYLKNHQKIHN